MLAVAMATVSAQPAAGAASADMWPVWVGLAVVWTAMIGRLVVAGGGPGARIFPRLGYLAALVVAGAFAWLGLAGTVAPWLGAVLVIAALVVVAGIRGAWAASRHHARSLAASTTRDRLLASYVEKIAGAATESDIAALCGELVELAIGRRRFALALVGDGGQWTVAGRDMVHDDDVPAPEIVEWLTKKELPVTRESLDGAPPPLRPGLVQMFDRLAARAVVPITHRDRVLAFAIVGPRLGERGLEADEVEFLVALRKRLGWLLSLLRMRDQAKAQVEVAQDMALSAAVQASLLPDQSEVVLGGLSLASLYVPATQCGGDFWWARTLPDGRAMVIIGDVTGHGIASAMVTAAARGCADTAHRFFGDAVDLGSLMVLMDHAVRRAGGGKLLMTCFVTLVDTVGGRVTFANAGHSIPYLCRKSEQKVSLEVLAGRGNPLGSGDGAVYEVGTRDIAGGDVLVWYTDGIVECANLGQARFGDRRMQRLLRAAAQSGLGIREIRDRVVNDAFTFQEGARATDDMTLIVGEILPLAARP